MGLYQRITAQDATKVSVHRLGAGGGITRAALISALGLEGNDVTQLDALIATYQALPQSNVAQALLKAAFLGRMEDIFLLCETGDYTEAQARGRLGF